MVWIDIASKISGAFGVALFLFAFVKFKRRQQASAIESPLKQQQAQNVAAELCSIPEWVSNVLVGYEANRVHDRLSLARDLRNGAGRAFDAGCDEAGFRRRFSSAGLRRRDEANRVVQPSHIVLGYQNDDPGNRSVGSVVVGASAVPRISADAPALGIPDAHPMASTENNPPERVTGTITQYENGVGIIRGDIPDQERGWRNYYFENNDVNPSRDVIALATVVGARVSFESVRSHGRHYSLAKNIWILASIPVIADATPDKPDVPKRVIQIVRPKSDGIELI